MKYKTSELARKLLFLLIIASVICGCTTTLSKKASLVREAKEYSVEDCEFLGTVQGWSGWGDRAEGVGIHNARNQALERAASLGATHIVWVDIRGGLAPVARARAYNCGQREQASTVIPSPETSDVAGRGKSEKAATSAAGTFAKEKLAVMNLKAKHGVKESLAEGLSVVIRDTIQGFGNYEVISKEDVEVVAERTAILQSLGCDDTQCLINIGRALGTRFMVAGAISKFGDTFNISLRLIDTEGKDAGVRNRVNRNCECAEDELIEIAQVTAYLLLGRYSLQIYNSGQPSQSGKVRDPIVDKRDFVAVKKTEKQVIEKEKQKLAFIPKTETSAKLPLKLPLRKYSNNTMYEYEVKETVIRYNFYESRWNSQGSFRNDLVDNGNGTITDKATSLMWEKSGYPKSRSLRRAKVYVRKLNSSMFAGYSDWRLPTLDELASLLESHETNGMYIDPLFDKRQKRCWSSDKGPPFGGWSSNPPQAWHVNFLEGTIGLTVVTRSDGEHRAFPSHNYIRAVRGIK